MNKHLHRVIFNKARGLLMVVAENVSGQGKAPGTRDATAAPASVCVVTLGRLRFALMGALGLVSLGVTPVWANGIVADPGAPGGQRPAVINSANGTPQVNIQAPSAAGVSRNQYSQFDVDNRGAILNNSAVNSQTQLGGWVEGNPYLGNGSARVILNEVNASNPSQLRGYVEVAGQRAEVVIANPAGITCDGCGFINADRSTLTTGRAQLEDGRITGYRVEGGTLTITGKGLDARDSDYTDLIARTVEVNAGVWANDLKVTAGRNQVNADNSQATALADDGSEKPEVAIDVAQLGGMYAGKIKLVGTEAGVGVRNAGQIGARVGEVTLSADGKLLNQGAISSATATQVATTGDIDNSGSLYAKGELRVSTQGNVGNTGVLAAEGDTRVQAGTVRSAATGLLAAGVDAQGKSVGNATLQLQAREVTANGQNHASGALEVKADRIDLRNSQTEAGSLNLAAGNGDLDLSGATLISAGALNASSSATLRSDKAKVNVGNLQVSARELSNLGGTLGSNGVATVVVDELRNDGGTLSAGGTLDLRATRVDNLAGTIAASQAMQIIAGRLDNTGGTLGSVNGGLLLDVTNGALSNQSGRVEAAGDIQVLATGIDNRSGTISGAALLLDSRGQATDNDAGTLNARTTLDLRSGELRNSAGLIQAGGSLVIDTGTQALRNSDSGDTRGIVGQGDVTLRSAQLSNDNGFIAGKGELLLAAATLSNQGEIVGERSVRLQGTQLDNQAGKVQARGALVLEQSQAIDNRDGLLRSADQLSVTTAQLDNRNTVAADTGIEAQSLLLRADTLDNRSGALRADNDIDLGLAERLANDAGLVSAGGELRLADRDPAQSRLRLENGSGTLIAGRLLSMNAAWFSGTGRALSLGDLILRQQGDLTNAGQLQANGTLDVDVSGRLTNSGKLLAGSSLLLRGQHLDNTATGELSATRVDLRLTGQLHNRGLVDGQRVRLQADELLNVGTGRLYGDQLAIASSNLINRDEGGRAATIAARDRLDIGSQRIDNREQALIFSAGNLAVGGALDDNDQATGRAALLTNASATLESLGDLRLSVSDLRNTNEHFSTTQVVVSSEALRDYQISGSPNRYRPDQISIHNDEVDYLTTPDGQRDNFNRYDYTRTVTETRIATSAPGQILAGGNLTFTGDTVFNDKSRILAGGLLQAGAAQVTNTEVDGERVTTDAGTATNFYRIQRKGRDRQGSNIADYRPAPLIQDIDLTPTEYGQNAAIAGSGTQIDGRAQQQVGEQLATVGDVSSTVGQQHQVGAVVEVKLDNGNEVRTGGLNLVLPSNSLFQTNPEAVRGYLIESDPRFTSYRQWLSSDYMFERLQVDPAQTQQRLGDGFYEQKLIREQVAQLTGRRFLDGFASDEAQYRSLIDNAVTIANTWNLVPGVALTAEQMAQLTSDIVWMVERSVTLPNGEARTVLVPQVYVQVREGDLNGNGALIAGQQLRLDLTGDLANSGSLGARNVMALTAQNIDNLGGRIQGNEVALQTRENLNNLGGLIGATNRLAIDAGNDINARSLTRDSSTEQGTRTNVSRVAGLFVSGDGGTMRVAAGNDLNLLGAQVVSAGQGGQTLLQAGRDVNLGTVAERHTQSVVWNSSNWRNEASRGEVGSTVQSTGDLRIRAGQDIAARGASITSDQGMVLAQAARDVNLTAAEQYQFADEAHKFKGKSSLFSSKTTTLRDTVSQTQADGSMVSAEQTYLQAGRDINLQGSDVVSTQQTILVADRDVNIEAATESSSERHDKTVKKSGLFSGGGLAVTIGTQTQAVKDLTVRETARASTVGSTEGDVLIEAGRNYAQVGSDVVAPKGDVDILAQQIAITEARETSERTRETLFKQTGFTVTITNPVISAIQTSQQMNQAAQKAEDGRMQVLAASTAALAVNNAATAVAQDPGAAGGINISLSLGTKKQESTTVQQSDSAAGSTVVAGNDVSLRATGAGADSDITVQGSQVRAGRDALLAADGDINLLAARNTSQLESDSKGSSASIGIGLSIGGTRTGFTLDVGVNGNRGEADGDTLTHTNSLVQAGETATLVSGGDTNLRGAVVSGRQVVADVGGDLNIESLQDTDTFEVDEKSMGFGVSLCVPPFCVGMSSISGASANFGGTDMDSDYASVTEQSGIKAGDGGFDVRVGGNTDLRGAVIASSDKAVEAGRNRLETASLTTSDIRNKAEYEASSVNVGAGFANVGTDRDLNINATGTATPGTELPNEGGFSAPLPVVLGANDSASSTTRSGISGGLVIITDDGQQRELTGQDATRAVAGLNRDVSSDRDASDSLKPIFDEEKIRAGFEITGTFTRQVGTFLDNKAKESTRAQQGLDEERAKPLAEQDTARIEALKQTLKDNLTWEFGGTSRAVLTALTAAAGGNISGSGVGMLQATAVNYLQGLATQQVKVLADKLDSEVARTALHAVLGCAGAAAQSASCTSAAMGASASVVLNNLVEQATGQAGAALTPAEKEARKNLVSSLISGITAASGGEAAIANTAAQIESENNAFWIPVIIGGAWLIDKGLTAYSAWQDIQALRSGETTLDALIAEKSEDYITQVLIGNAGKYGLKIVRHGGDWVVKKLGDHVDSPTTIGSSTPYNPREVRAELEEKYGTGNVLSTTVPPLSKPNVRLAGQHKEVQMPDGSRVRVVFDQKGFPIFDDVAKYDTRLDVDTFRSASYERQLRMATRDLRAQINSGSVNSSAFSAEQMTAIQGGYDKIPGFTWHHHQDTGRMQLVPEAVHNGARHVGWESMSKGQ